MESKDGVDVEVELVSVQLSNVTFLNVENKECQTVDAKEVERQLDVVYAEVIRPSDDSTYEIVSECSVLEEENTAKENANNSSNSSKSEADSPKEHLTCPMIKSEQSVAIPFESSKPKEASKVSSASDHARRDSEKEYKKRDDIEIPPNWIIEKIIQEAEFYFSDWNVFKNNFLLKHIRRNRDGYISVKLLASFRKIKAHTRDWRVVAYCVEGSKLLELNPEKTKVRRIEPLPKLQDTALGKTVIAYNLPAMKPTDEELKELFSKFGTVVSAEIMNPKSPTYNIYHKRCRLQHQEISSNTFGAVEFERYEDALRAIKDEDSHFPKENKMKVVPLLPQIFGTNPRSSRYNPFAPNGSGRGRFMPRTSVCKSYFRNGYPGDYDYNGRSASEMFYRGHYWRQSPAKTQSCNEIKGKQPMDNVVARVDGGKKKTMAQRQLKSNNSMNV